MRIFFGSLKNNRSLIIALFLVIYLFSPRNKPLLKPYILFS